MPCKSLLGLILATVAAIPVTASADLNADLDAALEDGRQTTGAPAATGAVIRCGALLWSGGTGVLDFESGRPATPAAMTAVASSTKPITATLVLDLVERDKLSLGTRLARFYPRLPKAKKITVRMLLSHRSGLNEYFDDPDISQTIANDPDHHWRRREVLRGITRTLFEPGTRSSYSNSGYVVLGGVIEKTSEKPVAELFRKRIANPLRLDRATFAYRPNRSDLFAHPYVRENGSLRDAFAPGVGVPADYWGPVWTDGGVAATAPELANFGDALFGERLLRPKTVRTMTRRGLGIARQDYADRAWQGHDGAYGGYESELWHDATRGLTIAVTTTSGGSAASTWRKVVDAYDRNAPGAQPCG